MTPEEIAKLGLEAAWQSGCPKQDKAYQIEVINRHGEELARLCGAIVTEVMEEE